MVEVTVKDSFCLFESNQLFAVGVNLILVGYLTLIYFVLHYFSHREFLFYLRHCFSLMTLLLVNHRALCNYYYYY